MRSVSFSSLPLSSLLTFFGRQLRRQPGMENVLLVAMTGYGQEQDRRRAREAGFNAHCVKPVDLDALQALLVRSSSSASDQLRAMSE